MDIVTCTTDGCENFGIVFELDHADLSWCTACNTNMTVEHSESCPPAAELSPAPSGASS